MNLTEVIFLLLAGLTFMAAFALALTRALVRAAFWLFAVLLGVAALYAFVGADVLAVSQVVVYVGGILILIAFGIMLTQKATGTAPSSTMSRVVPALGLLGILGIALLQMIRSYPVHDVAWASAPTTPLPNVQAIGLQTMTHWLIPFEAVSILLLIALVGAAFLARADR